MTSEHDHESITANLKHHDVLWLNNDIIFIVGELSLTTFCSVYQLIVFDSYGEYCEMENLTHAIAPTCKTPQQTS